MSRPVGQAVSERRPLRRRPVTMARPARVRIRNRNPWTLARRRLFGWKVRLPLATAISPRHFSGNGHRGHSRSTAAATVAKSPTNRRGPGNRSLPCHPWLGDPDEGTEVASAGQTALFRLQPALWINPTNVLAQSPKPVSFCQCGKRDRRFAGFRLQRTPSTHMLRHRETLQTCTQL